MSTATFDTLMRSLDRPMVVVTTVADGERAGCRLLVRRHALLEEGGDHVCTVTHVVEAHSWGPFEPLLLSHVQDLVPGHQAEERPSPPPGEQADDGTAAERPTPVLVRGHDGGPGLQRDPGPPSPRGGVLAEPQQGFTASTVKPCAVTAGSVTSSMEPVPVVMHGESTPRL